MSEAVLRSAEAWHRKARAALEAAGAAPHQAEPTAAALLAAERDGIASHGLTRVPAYAAQVASGKVAGRAEPAVTAAGSAALRVDARHGFAYPALEAAIERLAALTAETTVALAGIAHSHHFGVAGHHVERLAERGCVGLMMGNAPAAMAPWGGKRALLGTNPIAFAAPRRDAPPLVIDLSLTKTARGKIILARQRGERLPEGLALDPDGQPTTDPEAALAGSLLPSGDAKGAQLALMVEILAAALTGSSLAFNATSFFDDQGPAPDVGQCLLAIAPGAVSGGAFDDRLAELLAAITAEPGTRLPGQRRLEQRRHHDAAGISVGAELAATLDRLAEQGR